VIEVDKLYKYTVFNWCLMKRTSKNEVGINKEKKPKIADLDLILIMKISPDIAPEVID